VLEVKGLCSTRRILLYRLGRGWNFSLLVKIGQQWQWTLVPLLLENMIIFFLMQVVQETVKAIKFLNLNAHDHARKREV
jgi:hypothetical protein